MESDVRLRISVMGLFIQSGTVLMIHKMTDPEPDCWDLPGGGLQPGESIVQALKREIREETGLTECRVESLLTVVENFFPNWQGRMLHSLSIIYRCSTQKKPVIYATGDREVGEKGVQWLTASELSSDMCSTRSWKALEAIGLVKN